MAITAKDLLKSWFERGDKPTQAQFHALLDSYRHRSDPISQADIENLMDTLASKASVAALDLLSQTLSAQVSGALGAAAQATDAAAQAALLAAQAASQAEEALIAADEIVEYDTIAEFPPAGEEDRIYVAKDTNKAWRWNGTEYITWPNNPLTFATAPDDPTNTYHSVEFSVANNEVTGKVQITVLDGGEVPEE